MSKGYKPRIENRNRKKARAGRQSLGGLESKLSKIQEYKIKGKAVPVPTHENRQIRHVETKMASVTSVYKEV